MDALLSSVAVVALILSTLSRFCVAFLGAPAAINFLHFPVVAGLFMLSLFDVRRTAAPIYVGCGALLAVYAISAAINGAGAINATVGYVILAEPFLLFAVLLNSRSGRARIRRFGWWLLFLAVVQIPVAYAQAPTALATRNLDLVQGTFTGMVAGHHVLGGLAMVGAVHLFRWPESLPVWIRWPVIAALLGIVLLSDSKQVMLAFLAGYACLLALKVRSAAQAFGLMTRLTVLVGAVYAAQWLAGSHTYFHQAADVVSAFFGKFVVFSILVDHFDSVANWIVGLGPGHGVTRMGGWLLEKYWNLLEPLGATRTGIGAEAWEASGDFGERSSLFIPLFSWAGIFGDVGLAGLAAYGALLWFAWRVCVDESSRLILVSTVCLGFLFEWLEEPNFMLYALAVIAHRWMSDSAGETGTTTGAESDPRKSLPIACLVPTGGLHWYPALVEWSRRHAGLTVITARESFAEQLRGSVDVEVVGRARVFGEDAAAAGYRARLTWVSPRVAFRLWRLRPALVFTNTFGIWTAVAVLLAPFGGWRVVIVYEGSAPGVDFRDSPVRTRFRRFLARRAEACVSNTEVGREYLTDVLGAPPQTVFARPYLVPTQEFFDLESNRPAGSLSSLQRPLFLYVGKLTGRKGVRELLYACGRLRATATSRFSLVIVGDGALRGELESLAARLHLNDCIRWVGHVPHAEVGAYLRAADVLVLPTWEDTWGMTVPEAFLAGRPVLCSVRAGSSELVEDGRSGYLIDPNDPGTLADRMRHLIDHPELIEEMGRRGREVISEHTPAAVGEYLAAVAERVLQRSA